MTRGIVRVLVSGDGGTSPASDLGILVLRLSFGLALALAHGIGKLPPSTRFVAGVSDMGFPAPVFFAWASAFAEFFCAALIVAGLMTRPAAVFVIINMVVAVFVRQAGDPFSERELALAYLAVGVAIMLTGAGRYSIDVLLRARIDQTRASQSTNSTSARSVPAKRAFIPLSGIAIICSACASAPQPSAATSSDWPTYNRTVDGMRYSEATPVTTGNATSLNRVCSYAIDAATCREIWHTPRSYQPLGFLKNNHGVAYLDGRLFRMHGGAHAYALDAGTGRVLSDGSFRQRDGNGAPMAPIPLITRS